MSGRMLHEPGPCLPDALADVRRGSEPQGLPGLVDPVVTVANFKRPGGLEIEPQGGTALSRDRFLNHLCDIQDGCPDAGAQLEYACGVRLSKTVVDHCHEIVDEQEIAGLLS